MSENLQSCPVCGSLLLKHFLVCQDYTVSQQEFQIVRCESCGFKFTNPRPAEAEAGAFYQSQAYISHSNTSKGLVNKAYQLVRNFTLRRKLNLINSLVDDIEGKGGFGDPWFFNTLLDIGCGTGMFLKTCREAQWNAKGTEPDEKTRQFAIQNSGAEVQPDFLTAYPNERFAVITMWHVLEHVHRLSQTIQKIKQNLSQSGRLVVAVPNSDSWDAQKYREHWAAYDVPRHLYHFTPKSVGQLFEKFGFKIAAIHPMPFDAFYISMLSTQYRDGKINYAEALVNGLKSNSWARKNGKNYSSLIYVMKHAEQNP